MIFVFVVTILLTALCFAIGETALGVLFLGATFMCFAALTITIANQFFGEFIKQFFGGDKE